MKKKVFEWSKRGFAVVKRLACNRAVQMCFVAVFAMMLSQTSLLADIVELDGTGTVAFNPGELVTPITTAIIATITAVASIFVIVIGLRWMIRLVKGAK